MFIVTQLENKRSRCAAYLGNEINIQKTRRGSLGAPDRRHRKFDRITQDGAQEVADLLLLRKHAGAKRDKLNLDAIKRLLD